MRPRIALATARLVTARLVTARLVTARLVTAGLVAALGLVAAPVASAYGESHPNSQAVENCEANIAKQVERGVAAGGGKKEGIPAPTNCDHLFSG